MQTSTVPRYAATPLPALLRAADPISLASADPGISVIDLPHEYRVARDYLGLTPAELRAVQLNGLRSAFLDDSEKDTLLAAAATRA